MICQFLSAAVLSTVPHRRKCKDSFSSFPAVARLNELLCAKELKLSNTEIAGRKCIFINQKCLSFS